MVLAVAHGGDSSESRGLTYGGLAVRVDEGGPSRDDVLAALREIRFSGWLARPEARWLVAIAGSLVEDGAVPVAADDLAETLAEELDEDSVIESERLAVVLRLLGLSRWLVAVGSLPRDVPAGPRAKDFTRLGAGAEGFVGAMRGRAANVVRRRRPPEPAITDAPHGGGEYDPWLMWAACEVGRRLTAESFSRFVCSDVSGS